MDVGKVRIYNERIVRYAFKVAILIINYSFELCHSFKIYPLSIKLLPLMHRKRDAFHFISNPTWHIAAKPET